MLRIIKNTVPIEKSSINQVTKHAEETAHSSNSTLYKSPRHCRIESLSIHASLVHIESPMGSHAEPPTRPAPAGRSAPGRVKIIAKANIAMHTFRIHHASLKQKETDHMISMLRKEACSGSIHDLAHIPAPKCLADCLTAASAKADNLITAAKTEDCWMSTFT